MIKRIRILQNSHTTRLASEEDDEVNRRGKGSAEKAPAETETVRKPLPEPDTDRVGCPKQFHLRGKRKF